MPFKGRLAANFHTPRALTEVEIYEIIDRFGYAAKMAKSCGFHGVQIHGAHGYLLSQFLSPRHNQRRDDFGGTLNNRMRFAQEVIRKVRAEVGVRFPVAIKMNSADFSAGGFTNEEAVKFAAELSNLGVDLVEISGGSYEAPIMTEALKESTRRREAYFLDYAKEIKTVVRCPLMITGGFRTRAFMDEVIAKGETDLIGMARPLVLNPQFCREVLDGRDIESEVRPLTSGFRKLDSLFPLEIIWYTHQIQRMGRGLAPKPKMSVYPAIIKTLFGLGAQSLKRVRA